MKWFAAIIGFVAVAMFGHAGMSLAVPPQDSTRRFEMTVRSPENISFRDLQGGIHLLHGGRLATTGKILVMYASGCTSCGEDVDWAGLASRSRADQVLFLIDIEANGRLARIKPKHPKAQVAVIRDNAVLSRLGLDWPGRWYLFDLSAGGRLERAAMSLQEEMP